MLPSLLLHQRNGNGHRVAKRILLAQSSPQLVAKRILLGQSSPQLNESWHRLRLSSSLFSTNTKKEERKGGESEEKKQTESQSQSSLRETLRRMQNEGKEANKEERTASEKSSDTSSFQDFTRQAIDSLSTFQEQVGQTWQDLLKSGDRKDINKKIHPTETKDAPYTGPVDIMIIDPSENLTAWERMQKRLTDAPIIQDVLTRSEEFYEKSGAANVKKKVDDIKEDAKEAWETSQNPWVYRASSVYDTMTAETPESIAVRELRELDPEFTLDDWREDVVEKTLPQIMQWFLEGRISQLEPWLGESVFKRIASEITARKQEGVQIDTHVLGIMNSEILAVEPDEVNKGSPIILLHFMVQQINCVRKKDDGTIVEGAEDDIKANSYVTAFQREYNEERGELNWKIVDFRFNGAIAYL